MDRKGRPKTESGADIEKNILANQPHLKHEVMLKPYETCDVQRVTITAVKPQFSSQLLTGLNHSPNLRLAV